VHAVDVRLSILIPSIPERLEFLAGLTRELTTQVGGAPVEILVFLDNKRRALGSKRNTLIEMAQGDYVVFVDDDDWVAPTYVRDLLAAIDRHPAADCVVFDVACHINGRFIKIFRHGVEYGWEETADCIFREPGPLMCWRREILTRFRFPDQGYDPDSPWIAAGPWKHEPIRQERIERVLYEYRAVPGHP
jgi:glycosyltransferase involved in cell wall biosynthesis